MPPGPPSRVHRVILHLPAPETPVPVPVPSPEVHHPPQTPPSPPLPPPNMLPSNSGLPIPNDSQHSAGTPGNVPTYAPQHGGMFYPPIPVYPQHQPPFPPYGGISAIQPWSYTRYTAEQVAELGRRFLVHPLAIEHAA